MSAFRANAPVFLPSESSCPNPERLEASNSSANDGIRDAQRRVKLHVRSRGDEAVSAAYCGRRIGGSGHSVIVERREFTKPGCLEHLETLVGGIAVRVDGGTRFA